MPYFQITHKYTTWGNKTVTLTVYDTEGKSNSTSANVTIYARPVAEFTISGEHFVDHELTFNGTKSRDDDGMITSYFWDFGDGTNSTGNLTTHVYHANGTYWVNLSVIDNDGLIGFKSESITIGLGTPIADFEIIRPSPYYVDETLTFNASKSKADGGTIINYFLDWNDSTIDDTAEPLINHTFTQPKVYNVTLIVTDSDGKTSAPTSKNVPVILRVLLEVMPENVTADPPNGTFKINVTVANVDDLKSFKFTLSWPKDWLPPTYDLLDYVEAKAGDFLGPERYPNGTRRWNFIPVPDDGEGYVNVTGIFTDVVPVGERRGNGTLATITFQVKASGNATLDLKDTILQYPNGSMIVHSIKNDGYFYTTEPVANFTYSPPHPAVNEPITFDASASYDPDSPSVPILNYTWDFGDYNITSVTGTLENPPSPIIDHSYEENRTYTIILFVTDDDGETWNITYPLTVVSGHDVAIIAIEPSKFAFNETSGEYETSGELPINVTVMNSGNAPEEIFNVTLYATNTTHTFEIGTQTVRVSIGSPKNVTFLLYAFKWNDINTLQKGNYTIGANITWVEYDSDPNNNWFEDGVVRVYVAGDIPIDGVRDGVCNMRDIGECCNAFGSNPEQPKGNPNADLNYDGNVNMRDIGIACNNFGNRDP